MPIPRSEQIDLGTTPYYHCMSRCVRRAFLCGEDSVTGRSFEHRRAWIRDRLMGLAEVFAIDVCAYAVMSNHLHVVVHVDAERAREWSDDEVVQRYCGLYRMAKSSFDDLSSVAARKERLALWRARLSSLSWMMRALNEWVARRANKEDGVRGHFWESRFKSQPLLDEKGLLTCMAYVDLNPVRAGLSKSLEESDFTSIQDRLLERANNERQKRKRQSPVGLAPFEDEPTRATFQIPFDVASYLAVVEWAGSQLAAGKRGSQSTVPPLLRRLGLRPDAWVHALRSRRLTSATFLGSPASIELETRRRGGQWSRGIRLARALAA